jgi:hypothetical protein
VRHPLAPQVERRVDAGLSLHRLGDTANAVILAELSGVIFLDLVLSLMMWDEGATPDETALAFDRTFKRRLLREYAGRLGGDWNLLHQGRPVGQWYADLYVLRNRVLHGGYVPDRDEATTALHAADALSTFISDRILDRCERFPRTALIVFGHEGLERRGVLSSDLRRVADELEAEASLFDQYNERQAAVDVARSAA